MTNEPDQKSQLFEKVREAMFPPTLDSIKDGWVTWKVLAAVDYGTLGYLLSCHLIVEHYLTEALKSMGWPARELNWDSARLTFNQKVNLFPTNSEKFRIDMVPCLKHFNKLRNKFSHDIGFRLSNADVEPFSRFLKETAQRPDPVPSDPTLILELFTLVVCSYFAGYIVSGAEAFRHSRPEAIG